MVMGRESKEYTPSLSSELMWTPVEICSLPTRRDIAAGRFVA